MDYVSHFATVAGIGLLAALSPGPNFVMITTQALASRRSGLWAAAGVAAASLTWAMAGAMGLALVVAQVAWLYEALRIAGALYLVYLGLRMLWSVRPGTGRAIPEGPRLSGAAAFRRGYVVNMANPKSAAFVAGFYAAVLPADAPGWLFPATGLTVAGVSAAWSFTLALLLSAEHIRRGFLRLRRGITALLGVALVGLGARLALTR
ncbi:LysE family translocator [Salinarimonas soli]|uniref:LysE family translocator n=1 Tax=Salinarimonas soli TaxID=1638099 RepID=A0A5B2VEQ8_9HYPH|nr:LysE family translocator [Salinarimonas soli]KAA2238033.1 LysE family translocator [Salinarimonas soli]